MKKMNNFLRRIAGKNVTHYIIAVAGICFVCAGAEAVMTGLYLTAFVLLLSGLGMIVHAVWFLYEILDCFSDEDSNE